MEEDNLLALCPNHHRLFDRGALNDEERARMDEVAPNWKQHRARR